MTMTQTTPASVAVVNQTGTNLYRTNRTTDDTPTHEGVSVEFATEFYDRVGHFWDKMTDDDRRYTTTPPPNHACGLCGGVTKHSENCQKLHDQWAMSAKMPWGRYRGKRLAVVPDDYLGWVWEKDDLNVELRSDIRNELDRRQLFYDPTKGADS